MSATASAVTATIEEDADECGPQLINKLEVNLDFQSSFNEISVYSLYKLEQILYFFIRSTVYSGSHGDTNTQNLQYFFHHFKVHFKPCDHDVICW